MPSDAAATKHLATPNLTGPDEATIQALSRLLGPLACLCLANGVTFATVEDLLKKAFVQEADALQPGETGHGKVSRISNATGINRREVTRLARSDAPARPTRPLPATEVFARWTTDPALRDRDGAPLVLRRLGPAPSFETLAQSVTRDVHPRSLLEELVRLGLARHDAEGDTVTLVRSEFVPGSDNRQMLALLGDNVGDHLEAAVANVTADGRRHFEQAVFADELSDESVETLRPLVTAHWETLRDAMVPALTTLIEADRLAGRRQDRRVRIGLYSFSDTTSPDDENTIDSNHKSRKGVRK